MNKIIKLFAILFVLSIAFKIFIIYSKVILISFMITSFLYFSWIFYYKKPFIRNVALKHIGISAVLLTIISATIIEQINPNVFAQPVVTPTVVQTKPKQNNFIGKTMYIDDESVIAIDPENLAVIYECINRKEIAIISALRKEGKVYFFKAKTPIIITETFQNESIAKATIADKNCPFAEGYVFTKYLKN